MSGPQKPGSSLNPTYLLETLLVNPSNTPDRFYRDLGFGSVGAFQYSFDDLSVIPAFGGGARAGGLVKLREGTRKLGG